MSVKTQNVILHRLAGKDVPKELIEKALASKPSTFSATLAVNGSLIVNKVNLLQNPITVDMIADEVIGAAGDNPVYMHFGTFSDTFLNEDVQPFHLMTNEDGTPAMVCYVSGDYPRTAKGGSVHSEQYEFVHEMLKPKLSLLTSLTEGDIDKVYNAIRSTIFHNELSDHFVGDASAVLLIGADGTTFSFEKPAGHMIVQPWGRTTNLFDGKSVIEPAKKTGFWDKGFAGLTKLVGGSDDKKQVEAAPPSVKPTEQPGNNQPTELPEQVPAEATPIPQDHPAVANSPFRQLQLPKGCNTNEEKRKWWNTNLGYCPDNWKSHHAVIKVPSAFTGKLSNARELKALIDSMSGKKEGEYPDKKVTQVGETTVVQNKAKDTATKFVGVENRIPIITADMRKQIEAFLDSGSVKKYLDENSQEAMNPKVLGALQSKLPNYFEVMAIDGGAQKFMLPYEILVEHCKQFPEASAVLIFNFQNEFQKLLGEVNHLIEATPASTSNKPTEAPAKVAAAGGSSKPRLRL